MGMTASYQRIDQVELDQFLKDQDFAMSFVGLDSDDPFEFYQELEATGKRLDIQKEWQSLHFLLTQEVANPGDTEAPAPLRNVVLGGTETDCEATYGVVRYLTPSEVKDVAEALSRLSESELAARFDPDLFNQADLYASADWNDESFGYLLDVFRQVSSFFQKAADSGDGMLLSLD
jgi:hypothetical protein